MVDEKIKLSYQELNSLKNDSIYTFFVLDRWLLKYGDLYKSLKNSEDALCDKCKEYLKQGFPLDCLLYPSYCVKTKAENTFIKHYESLDYFIQIFKNEDKCMSAVEVYYMTPIGNDSMRQWLINNYELWNVSLFEFGVLYLDDDNLVELMGFHLPKINNHDFKILVKRKNFKNIEEFLDIYGVNFFDK